ncbi:MAG: Rrf2 family transcriptional regulator [Deltaproteobacteria bacterium]|nr:Rrf2 family transcriptional regulator [Deltaproteobacteria bacterium]
MGTKGLYGLLALGELVQNYKTNRPIQVKDIAQRQKIPEEYLGQIMVLLKRANLVRGTRGPGGGYQLARPPESITVGEVVTCLEGRPSAFDVKGQKNPAAASTIERRLMETWQKAMEASEKVLAEVSLADLCKPEERSQMYYI